MRIIPPKQPETPGKQEEVSRGFTRATGSQSRVAEKIAKILLELPSATLEEMFTVYRAKYGEGAYLYAKRTVGKWQRKSPTAMGQTLIRLLELLPPSVDPEVKFAIVEALRDVSLRRQRFIRMKLRFRADGDLTLLLDRLMDAVESNYQASMPPSLFDSYHWINEKDGAAYWEIQRKAERDRLSEQALDFYAKAALLQRFRCSVTIPLGIRMFFEIPGATIHVSILGPLKRMAHSDHSNEESNDLLARWQDLELESRFKSGDMSYPEYVLRNMDQFFTKDQQAELHKLAAKHGLELERLLMEIQIKSRTSEADLQKLLNTLKTLQEKGITADIVSRHETPSGHIEISARSGRKWGCLPFGGVLLMLVMLGIWLA